MTPPAAALPAMNPPVTIPPARNPPAMNLAPMSLPARRPDPRDHRSHGDHRRPPPRQHGEGILFDTAYLEPEIHLWVRLPRGELLHVHTLFHPTFHLAGPPPLVERAAANLAGTNLAGANQAEARLAAEEPGTEIQGGDRPAGGLGNSGAGGSGMAGESVAQTLGWTRRIEFWSGVPIPVMALRALRPGRLVERVRGLLRAERRLTAYDVDLDPTLVFHSRHGLFPLARVALSWRPPENGPGAGAAAGMGGELAFIRALDSPDDPGYILPELRVLTLRLTRSPLIPLGGVLGNPPDGAPGSSPNGQNSVRAEIAGESCEIAEPDPAPGLRAFNALLERHDPDLIDSVRGDQTIFPWLLEAASRTGIALKLDRAAPPVQRRITRRTRAIVVYGQVLFKAAAYPLLGRWHLDRVNSFFIDKAGIEGLVELARLSRMPIQRQARASGGTAMTSMEIDLALRQGMLVPFIKDQVEDFRPASELLRADKGGLSYFPPVGIWEQVIELDFAQQYPTIMAVYNISPETMNCACCVGRNPVPGVAHHTCSRRRGLVPEALAGLLAKRLKYKKLLKECPPEERIRYEARQSAIKWTLVTTFGYQGFKSAKFGHIAAHEAITAWGRETLLIAKETFEAAGYRMLHALTDSLYVVKSGSSPQKVRPKVGPEVEPEVERLARSVQQATGLTLGVEGVYDWICFLPSKVRSGLSVATRYFGRFSDGSLKLRGLKVRQHGTPPFIREAQESFLAIMQSCRSRAELEAATPRLRAAYQQARAALWRGRVPPGALAIAARVTRELERYKANSPVAVCLRILAARGIRIPPGQKVRYVIADRGHADPLRRYVPEPFLDEVRQYDAAAYQALLLDAFKEVTINLEGPRAVWEGPRQETLW